MSQIQSILIEWERHQMLPNQKHMEFYATQPNQKAIEWLETQTHPKEWEVHKKREEIKQRAKNGEPIVVENHLNSEHDILTMVEQVLLTKNEFSDDSSIFVVVPSIDYDAGNSSDHRNSSICLQMSENHMSWKKRDNLVERDPKQRRNNSTNQGVKLSSKGKMIFIEGLPTDTLSYHNKETMFDRKNSRSRDDWKKPTKHKLCQITTPNEIVERIGNRCNVVSMDTTVDRPCCCSARTNQYSDYNSNNRHVTNVISNLITPVLDRQGINDNPFYVVMGMKPRDSVRSATTPLAPCNIRPCRLHRTPHHTTAPSQLLDCVPTQQYTRAFSQQHTRVPIQQLTCAPTHPLTWPPEQHNGEGCPTQRRAEACPNQRRSEGCPTQQHAEPCPTQNRAEVCPTCECSPEQLLRLFKIALKGGNWQGMPSLVCGECPEPPETQTMAPPAEPTPEDTCLCEKPEPKPACACDVREKNQKLGSIRQTRFNSTVGTSTDLPFRPDKQPKTKTRWFSWRKNVCECSPVEPEPEPKPEPVYDPEPHLTLESYFQLKDSNILSAEILKKNSLETERVSGFRLTQDKREPPEPESDYTVEDAIRYLAMMNPDVFQNIMAEQQAKLDGTYKPPPPPLPSEVEPPSPPADAKEGEGPFKGLKFKIGGKGSASKGLAGVCCFDLLTESFTTW